MIKCSLSFVLHDYKDGIQKFRYRTEMIDTKFSQDALSYYGRCQTSDATSQLRLLCNCAIVADGRCDAAAIWHQAQYVVNVATYLRMCGSGVPDDC